jgi:ribonuclease VapC
VILDSSAVISIVCREPGYEQLVAKLREADSLGVGAPTMVEIGLLLEGRFQLDGRSILERFVRDFELVVVPFGDAHWLEAVDAYRRFGKGRHPAALNFGDCLSYATAKLAERPLLFVGDDFSKTDLQPSA